MPRNRREPQHEAHARRQAQVLERLELAQERLQVVGEEEEEAAGEAGSLQQRDKNGLIKLWFPSPVAILLRLLTSSSSSGTCVTA